MKVIAHRGFAGEAPENTLLAIRQAADAADAVEVDVRRCGSGEPVVFHDETVDRLTAGTGTLADLALDELEALTVLDSGEGIPTLSAVVEAVPPETELFVELKETGMAADVLDALAEHPGRVLVTSFLPEALEEVEAADPGVPRGLVVGDRRSGPVREAEGLGCTALLLQWRLAFVPWIYRAIRRSDLEAYAWTVRRRVVARALSRLDLDGLIVDGRTLVPGVEPERGDGRT